MHFILTALASCRRLTSRRSVSVLLMACLSVSLGILLVTTLGVAGLGISTAAHAQQQTVPSLGSGLPSEDLPQMGEPADQALSPEQERYIGQQYMRQIRARLPLVQDREINEYVHTLGSRLVANAATSASSEFNFFVLEDLAINAFAIPGGHIGINAGLILAMEKEEQLAGVVAHEIAHVTQRHHARAVATLGKNRLSTAAAILAAIIISSTSPTAGQAALAAGLAISQQSAVNYTRLHEYEADRIGIQVLSDAGFDPAAIADTFEIMRRRNSINTSSNQIEYLRTHPLDSNRIAEAKSRAASLDRNRVRTTTLSGRRPHSSRQEQLDFAINQARLNVLTANDDARLRREYASRQLPSDDTDAGRSAVDARGYALALLSVRSRQYQRAKDYLQPALARNGDNQYLRLLEATIENGLNNPQKASGIYRQLLDVYPASYAVMGAYTEHLVAQRELNEALSLLTQYQRSVTTPNYRAWRELANIQEKLGQRASSHESLASYFLEINELKRSEEQLMLALKTLRKGSNSELRVSSKLRDVRQRMGIQ